MIYPVLHCCSEFLGLLGIATHSHVSPHKVSIVLKLSLSLEMHVKIMYHVFWSLCSVFEGIRHWFFSFLSFFFYSLLQVFVSSHIPPPPKQLHELMEKYDQWLGSAEAAALHPIARAAMDHFKLVHIHPFIDGNGRLSRLVMNIRLMQVSSQTLC